MKTERMRRNYVKPRCTTYQLDYGIRTQDDIEGYSVGDANPFLVASSI